MLAYIKGVIASVGEAHAVLETSGGAAYRVFVSPRVLDGLRLKRSEAPETPVILHTRMLASENSVRLFGFADAEDAAAYELLLTVSGVGPKAAMAILDALPAPRLKAAIASGDDKLVASARGVGAKTAQVLILKLRDKMGELPALPDAPPGERSPRGEAAEALLSLGYTKAQAAQAVAAVAADGKNSEEIIRAALKKLSK